MFALGKSTNDAEFAITGERKQQMRRFSQPGFRGKREEGRGRDFYNSERQEEKPHQRRASKCGRAGLSGHGGILTNGPISNKTSVKKKTSNQDCYGGIFDSEAVARPCYFKRPHLSSLRMLPLTPSPGGGFGGTRSPRLVPVAGELSRGGTSRCRTPLAPTGKERNGCKCVCWRGESLQVPVSLCQTSSHTQMSA